jgi:hypothetical protein
MDRVYRSRDRSWLSVHGGLATMGQRSRSEAQEVIVMDRRERERGHRGSHQWRHLEAELRRWPHDGAKQRRPVVLRWGDGSGHKKRLEPRWVRWIMGVLLLRLL